MDWGRTQASHGPRQPPTPDPCPATCFQSSPSDPQHGSRQAPPAQDQHPGLACLQVLTAWPQSHWPVGARTAVLPSGLLLPGALSFPVAPRADAQISRLSTGLASIQDPFPNIDWTLQHPQSHMHRGGPSTPLTNPSL